MARAFEQRLGLGRAVSPFVLRSQLVEIRRDVGTIEASSSFHDRKASSVANTPLSCRPRLLRKRNQHLAQLGGSRDMFGEVEAQGQII